MRKQVYEQQIVRKDLLSICDKVYSFEVIAIHFDACYLGGILCASAVVCYVFYFFCQLYETVIIKICNIQFHMLSFICV